MNEFVAMFRSNPRRFVFGVFISLLALALYILYIPAEAYARWYEKWDLDTFGL